ncbi:MAG TPA: STAS domain-containing protein [Urbifossiella sp.]|nr:STAS domain-containing protein [Urbifossiella sp.]
MADQPDDFQIERVGDVTVFRFRPSSELTEETLGGFGESAFHVADTATPPRIVVDLRNVTFLSSACLGKLITLHRKVQGARGWLKVINLSPDVAEVFRITRLDRILDCHDRGDGGGGDDDEGGAGVPARLRPPAPSGGGAVALPPPAPTEPE